ncbi:hypothetical protein [Draconibacterium sediminis]|uniref:Bulb-type lectin domain-containing protein n=1 Tax=Draconibacterium sediminis TaxID=1544798 RepID=A0A0D8J6A7_9BACT|nr:hypothetical protein [Draconibacterium sediminis]KJF42061.1 hypothetical protein LH29_22555 [Draconibacterium sediminis]
MTTNYLRSFVLGIIIFSCFNCKDSSESIEPEGINPIEVPTESSIEFQKQYQTNDSIFTLNSAIQLIDSSYTIAGAVRYNGSYNKNVIMKFDKYGNRVWVKIMENTNTPHGIEKLFKTDNGYIGYRGHHYNFQNSSHIIYFNETGDVENEIFMNNDMLGNDMLREGNNFLIAGRTGGMFFRMINQNGELVWEKPYDSSYPEAFSITKLTDGNFISIGGGNYTGNGDFLIKLNELGEKVWAKNHKGLSVLAISNNEFLAIINNGNNGNLIRFNQEGNIVWSKQLDNFSPDVNKPSPSTIINYSMEYFICTYVNQNNNLKILVLDQNGNEINLHIIDNYSGADYRCVSKTIDDGILITYAGSIYNFGIIKLSNEFLFN